MTIYTKIEKNKPFKKINILRSEDNKLKREEIEPSNEESNTLENHYLNIISNIQDYDILISFDIYDINTLNGILNYRNKYQEHKQVRY
jgi:hypothetical protein